MRRIYYYVPPCPVCGGRKTGRYVRRPVTGSGYIREMSLKNGELVRFANEEPIKNAFCASCGHQWAAKITIKWWSYDRIHEEQVARGTESAYQELLFRKNHSATPQIGLFGRKKTQGDNNDTDVFYDMGKSYQSFSEEPEFIDRRKRDRVELLYADVELIKKIMEAQKNAQI